MTSALLVFVAGVGLAGCGVASISPLVTDSDAAYDPRLVGVWEDSSEGVSAVVTMSGTSYQIVHTDDHGKTGRFTGRLGRLGSYRVLDLQPEEPLPNASDTYKQLLLRTHMILVIDSIGRAVQFRILEPDSVKAYLTRQPQAVAHAIVENGILLTAPSEKARRFLADVAGRPGFLSKPVAWRRARQ